MTDELKVVFNDWTCRIFRGVYNNGRTALRLLDAYTGEPVATATMNLAHEQLEPDEVIIKNHSENEGMRECLELAGVVGPVNRVVNAGYTTATVHTLMI